MLDIKRIREDYESMKAGVERRTKGSFGIEKIPALDEKRRAVLAEVEAMKNKQNTVSKEIPKMKKAGEDTTAIMAEMKELSEKIKVLDAEVSQLDADIKDTLLNIPNIPADFVQVGEDDSANVEMRKFKEPTQFDFEPKAHWDIGTDLDILDWILLQDSVPVQEPQRFPAQDSLYIKVSERDLKEQLCASCSTFTLSTRTTRKFFRRSWLTVPQ